MIQKIDLFLWLFFHNEKITLEHSYFVVFEFYYNDAFDSKWYRIFSSIYFQLILKKGKISYKEIKYD